jgi:hypothetical protein
VLVLSTKCYQVLIAEAGTSSSNFRFRRGENEYDFKKETIVSGIINLSYIVNAVVFSFLES